MNKIEQSPKRKRYRIEECPYCHKLTRNVKNHILLAHRVDVPGKPQVLTKDDLLGKKSNKVEATVYHCTACGGKLRKEENPCPHCGESLAWSEIE